VRLRGGLFIDTSAWIASLREAETAHRDVVRELDAHDGDLVTSTWVLDESLTLARRRIGNAAAVALGRRLVDSGAVLLLPVPEDVWREAWRLFVQRPDSDYSFTDCTSFVLMRTLGIERVLTLDRDFGREGFHVVP
jgi:predicted nucleic acid-binding protein